MAWFSARGPRSDDPAGSGASSRLRSKAEAERERQGAAISGFWAWWESSGAALTAAAIDVGDLDLVATELTARLGTIHRLLAWELAPGLDSEHVLMASSDADPRLRPLTRRWLREAPAPNSLWSYADVRLAWPQPEFSTLIAEGHDLSVVDTRVHCTAKGDRIDLLVHHPAFAEMGRRARSRTAQLLVHQVIGEAAMRIWVSTLKALEEEPPGAHPLLSLRGTIAALRAQHLDPSGRPSTTLIVGHTPKGLPALAMRLSPLSAETYPDLETLIVVTLPYPAALDPDVGEGLPDPATLEALAVLQSELDLDLADSGRTVAHDTFARRRRLFVYVDGSTEATLSVSEHAARWPHAGVKVSEQSDPGWAAVAHLNA